MARPNILQRLKHGKLLTALAFPRFVETFNWLVGAFDNLKGDADVNPRNGCIHVDRTDPDVPVIRLNPLNLPAGNGGASPDDLSTELAPTDENGTQGKLQIKGWDDFSDREDDDPYTLARYLEDPSLDPDDMEALLRDAGLAPGVKYLLLGKLTGPRVVGPSGNGFKVVTDVEYMNGNGPSGHQYSIRITKQKVTMNASREIVLDSTKEYSYIDTIAHSAV